MRLESVVSADLTPYESARQFIKVSNLIRMYQKIGWDVPWSLQWDLVECRYRLDRALGSIPRAWTDDEWDDLIRVRLMAKGFAAA